MSKLNNMENSKNNNSVVEHMEKKPFNKKEWREKKYSNKYKLQQWEDHRRMVLNHKLQKELRKENDCQSSQTFQREKSDSDMPDSRPGWKKMSAFQKAQQEYNMIKEEKRRKREEMIRMKREREAALNKYKEKKAERFKKLSRKTRKGQPLMKDRIELLLEKIEKDLLQK